MAFGSDVFTLYDCQRGDIPGSALQLRLRGTRFCASSCPPGSPKPLQRPDYRVRGFPRASKLGPTDGREGVDGGVLLMA